ncbi:MAG: hypothetical protein AAGA54_15645 [Myxococcota bacterium]
MTAAFLLFAATSMASPPAQPAPVRVLAIELSADGRGGAIRTESERRSKDDRVVQFGEGACSRRTLGERVLTELFASMRSGERVVLETEPVDDALCLRRVTFVSAGR